MHDGITTLGGIIMGKYTAHEITARGPLLDKKGHLTQTGFAKNLILDYDRSKIKANALRIKEWDYYLIANDDFAVALTVADNGYMSLESYSLIDFRIPWERTTGPIGAFPMGKRKLPRTSTIGDTAAFGKKHFMHFENPGIDAEGYTRRRLSFHLDDFLDGKPFDGEILLTEAPGDSIVVATPFKEKATAFYYNQKINCMTAEGKVVFDGKEYIFTPDKSFACLDWGRGVWTYENTWYWGSASGMLDGKRFGFNIGYGFGDNPATENMLFYDGKAHKLSEVKFNIPMIPKTYKTHGSCCTPSGQEIETADLTEDYMSPWTFTSDDGRFEMDFVPIIDRASLTDVKIICSDQHQVFGKFTGKAVLDDGTVLEIKDFLGFAEKVYNKW